MSVCSGAEAQRDSGPRARRPAAGGWLRRRLFRGASAAGAGAADSDDSAASLSTIGSRAVRSPARLGVRAWERVEWAVTLWGWRVSLGMPGALWGWRVSLGSAWRAPRARLGWRPRLACDAKRARAGLSPFLRLALAQGS